MNDAVGMNDTIVCEIDLNAAAVIGWTDPINGSVVTGAAVSVTM